MRSAHQATESRRDHRMVHSITREPQGGLDIFHFKVRMLSQDLLRRHPRREELEHIGYPDPHAADARVPAALPWVYRDSIGQTRIPLVYHTAPCLPNRRAAQLHGSLTAMGHANPLRETNEGSREEYLAPNPLKHGRESENERFLRQPKASNRR